MRDLISRQAAIDAIVAQTIGYTVDEIKAECEENIFNENGYLGGLKDAIEAIEDISSAQPERCEDCENFSKTRLLIPQPERKKGRWIDSHTTCSECGWQMIDDVIESPNIVAFNFCPNCGADMREDAEEPKRCDTCKHEKERWFNCCADCFDYELWEGKTE